MIHIKFYRTIAIGGRHEKNVNEPRELVLYLVERYRNDVSYMNVHKKKQMVTRKVITYLSSQSDSCHLTLHVNSLTIIRKISFI